MICAMNTMIKFTLRVNLILGAPSQSGEYHPSNGWGQIHLQDEFHPLKIKDVEIQAQHKNKEKKKMKKTRKKRK